MALDASISMRPVNHLSGERAIDATLLPNGEPRYAGSRGDATFLSGDLRCVDAIPRSISFIQRMGEDGVGCRFSSSASTSLRLAMAENTVAAAAAVALACLASSLTHFLSAGGAEGLVEASLAKCAFIRDKSPIVPAIDSTLR